MRFYNVRSVVGALALVLSAGMVHAANNPAYDSWANLKVGSSVTTKSTSEASGQKTEIEMTSVLNEVTPDKVIVDVKTSMVISGTKMNLPARKQDILKSPVANAPATPAVPAPSVKQSEESVTIAGKTFKCQVTEASSDQNGMKVASKVWSSVEVPNNIVKMEASTTGAVASKTTTEVTKIEIK